MLPQAHDASRDIGRAEVRMDPRAVNDRHELFEGDIEPVRDRIRTWLDEGIAALDVVSLDARECDRDALARLRAVDRPVMDLNAADSHRAVVRLDAELVPLTDRARPDRPRDDGADPAKPQ